MGRIVAAARAGTLSLYVSRHSLAELTKDTPETHHARALVKELCTTVPYYPIGSWKELLGSWKDLAGTWNDLKENERIQADLCHLAKSGNDLRDRGAYLDALLDGVDAIVTSDKQLVGSGPAGRIASKYGLRLLTPAALAVELGL